MAIKATVYKAGLQIADMDRGLYADHALTLARQPSETDERLMVRVLAFARHAHEALAFTKGISTDDEPDLWQKDLTGAIDLWIDIGQPDEKRIRKACGRARQVVVLAYGGRKAQQWWAQNAGALARLPSLRVLALSDEDCERLQRIAARTMSLTATVQDGHVWLATTEESVEVVPQHWLPRP